MPDALTDRRLGRYHIHQEIGRGGMARVYRATDTLLQRTVALKVLAPQLSSDAEFARRFEREAVTAANLRHPAIITIFDVGESDDLKFIAMEFIAGRSLHAVIAERGPLGLPLTVALLAPVAEALHYAHGQGAIHRDIKPHNIMLGTDGRVLLADFGIAIGPQAGGERLTQAGAFLGTPEYLSPEQVQAEPLTGRSDQYSLAIVAFECLSGQVPFKGTTPQLLMAHVYTPPPSLTAADKRTPPEVDAVIARGLAKTPDARFGRATEFVDALRMTAIRLNLPVAGLEEIAALALPLGSSAGKQTVALSLPPRPSVASEPNAPFPIAEIFGTPPVAPRDTPPAPARYPPQTPPKSHARPVSNDAPISKARFPTRRPRRQRTGLPWAPVVFVVMAAVATLLLAQAFRNRVGAIGGNTLFVPTSMVETAGAVRSAATPAAGIATSDSVNTPHLETTAGPPATLPANATADEAPTLTTEIPPLGGGTTLIFQAGTALNLTDTADATTVELVGDAQSIGPAAFSPDGTRILYDKLVGETRHIFLLDRATNNVEQLTQGNDAYHPAWAPDGKSIVYASRRDGNADIYQLRLESSQEERLTDDPADDDYPSFRPNGAEIMWESQREGMWKIYLGNQDGFRRWSETASDADERYPRLSPDGSRVVFASNRDRRGEEQLDLYVQPFDGGPASRITELPSTSARGPQWTPDGQYIVFFSTERGNDDIYQIRLSDLFIKRLTDTPGNESWPVWGP